MLEFGACPRCKLDVSAERRKMNPVVCDHCGYSVSTGRATVNKEMEKKTLIIYGAISIFVLASFFQLNNWDNYSLGVIPLKVKQTIGMSSPADIEQMSEICLNLKKWDCVESEYMKAGALDSTKLPRLGHFQMKRSKYNEAAQSYYSFFQKGGSDLETSYSYAKALAELGQADEATKYFDEVLAARPDVLQVTVVHNYVKLLMAHNRYDQARKLISNIRGKGPETGAFMESEFKQIQSMTTAGR